VLNKISLETLKLTIQIRPKEFQSPAINHQNMKPVAISVSVQELRLKKRA